MKETIVRDWMSTQVISVPPEASAADAFTVMADRHVRHLPVAVYGRLLGILSLGDLRAVQAPSGVEFAEHIRAGVLMHDAVVTAQPDEKLATAVERMLEHKVGCLPVVFEGKIVGILTESDVMRAYIAEHERALAVSQPTSPAAKP
jgi:acetoin utilization protein AcuB